MKKPVYQRFGLALLQHIALAMAVVIVISLAGRLIIRVENLYGVVNQHRLDLYDEENRYEDTAVFSDMFDNAVSDLIMLAVIKGQLETDGVYDGEKQIDVTAFVNRKENISDCPITAVYYLDDLIKWSKSGLDMVQKKFTKKEFVNYFGDNLMGIGHFYLDEISGNLKYDGKLQEKEEAQEGIAARTGVDAGKTSEEDQEAYRQKLLEVYNNYLVYNEEGLVDMAFNFLVSHMDKPVSLSYENNVDYVIVEMLRPKYAASDGTVQLVQIADNWLDYCKLENNLIDTIEGLEDNYLLYESRNDMYARDNTNLSYLVRIPGENGYTDYSNMDEKLLAEDTAEIDNYFEDIGKYISYSVDDVECAGNVSISADKMLLMVETHDYAYTEGSRIWIGVDTSFPVAGDQFETGLQAYNSVVPRMWQYTAMITACLAVWVLLMAYMIYTAGRVYDEEGNFELKLYGFDKIHTEFELILTVGLFYGAAKGFGVLLDIAMGRDNFWANLSSAYHQTFVWYLPFISVIYGLVFSILIRAMFCSFSRRVKAGNLWEDSFLHWFWVKCYQGVLMVLYHRSTMVRTMIPYNLFILVNLFGLVGAYASGENRQLSFLLVVGVLLFDAAVGVILFRRNAEMADIMDVIKRIRQGESECRLEADKFHGENREIAEAVNNIGEGIRIAVETSMKDEKMKTDLITNVSHDIKTPLTSIISYVDLLKREKIQTEPIKSYVEILDNKTQRLKQLTDDLVEASKISSGNIVLEKEQLDLSELLQQALGEFSEKFEEQNLQVIFSAQCSSALIYADSRRMWRVVENLFHNVCKYAMPNTRVYVDVTKADGMVEVSVKNISQVQLNFHSDELTERFIRGDVARTTEGSGLGLSIAKSLTQAQGGVFQIHLDGDLFKVFLQFEEYQKEERADSEETERSK